MLTACLWERADLAMTNPDPLWHPDGLSAFGLGSHHPLLPEPEVWGVPSTLARGLGNLLAGAAGACGRLCQVPDLAP